MNGWTALAGFLGAIFGTIITGFLVEWYRQKNRLRLAAIDKRLEAHQQAYSLCFSRWLGIVLDEKGQVGINVPDSDKCFAWWRENCLYLSKKSRSKFIMSCYSDDEEEVLKTCKTIMKDIDPLDMTDSELRRTYTRMTGDPQQ